MGVTHRPRRSLPAFSHCRRRTEREPSCCSFLLCCLYSCSCALSRSSNTLERNVLLPCQDKLRKEKLRVCEDETVARPFPLCRNGFCACDASLGESRVHEGPSRGGRRPS